MVKPRFPEPFKHAHPPVRNINEIIEAQLTFGQKASDWVATNLLLSLQAAYAAPIIMMSQNRQATRDRLEAHNDYLINQKTEEEVRSILDHLAAQNDALIEIHQTRPRGCRSFCARWPPGSTHTFFYRAS